ncbi:MAG: SPASM domain-containing protein [Candidatus Competibacter sp.]|nr:SPASM domain-containing protein [Candidatus Competibacter sp.]
MNDLLIFNTDTGSYLFLVNGSQVFQIDRDLADEFQHAFEANHDAGVTALMESYGLQSPPHIQGGVSENYPVHALSLAIAQKCNLGCSYCYAEGGDFGGPAKNMSEEIARQSVERLIAGATPGSRLNLAFMGGEPLANRRVLRATTEYASQLAARRNLQLGFSVTTNGTLITPDDGVFFEAYGFAVTVSFDGLGADHDRLRPFRSGKGTFDHIIKRITPLLRTQKHMQVSTRVTVTPLNLGLTEKLQKLVDLGFHSVGFSPLLSAPNARNEIHGDSLDEMLKQMIACGRLFEQHLQQGLRFPFANMVNALREIHSGTHRPYPCGAGAGYLGVSADGELAACHRFVGNADGAMGTISVGIDREARTRWLSERNVAHQIPCNRCWARYLCGGGCHHEVLTKGRGACDYIRGWLRYCLEAYARLIDACPSYFTPEERAHAYDETTDKANR